MARSTILLVTEDEEARRRIGAAFESQGAETLSASDAAGALGLLRTRAPDVVVVDRAARGVAATDLLQSARRLRPTAPIVVVAERPASVPVGGDSGVFDAVSSRADADALRGAAARCLSHQEALVACARLRERLRGLTGHDALVGSSAVMDRLREDLRRAAATDSPVLFVGEPGSGRELAARTLHALSDLRELPFDVLDCREHRSEILERELFGAGRERVLFLDEVLELAEPVQRLLEERLARADAGLALPPATRVLAACASDPLTAAEQGRLSEVLCRRLAAATIRVPALRDRREDVSVLASRFIEELRDINVLPPLSLGPEALEVLESYHWPGNVRELRNAIEQAVVVAGEGRIEPRHLPERVRREGRGTGETTRDGSATVPFKEAKRKIVDEFERRYLRGLLERHQGNVTAAAQSAGMLRSALQRLLRKHGIRSAPFRRRVAARG